MVVKTKPVFFGYFCFFLFAIIKEDLYENTFVYIFLFRFFCCKLLFQIEYDNSLNQQIEEIIEDIKLNDYFFKD